MKATTSTYIGGLADVVRDDFSSGRLLSLAHQRQREASVLENEHDGIMTSCSAALTCNRPISNIVRGELDQYGMISVVCSHVIPGLGLSVPMLTPEQHYYYDIVLGDTLRRRPDLAVVYLDLACRYANGRWGVLLKELVDQEHITNEQRDRVQMLLPWMHAFDHDIKCQLKYGAMYKVRRSFIFVQACSIGTQSFMLGVY